jgi:hypothetical protein
MVLLLYENCRQWVVDAYRTGALTLEASGQWPVVSGQFFVGAAPRAKIN